MKKYQEPKVKIILLATSNIMQGIIEVSAENGPNVDPDNPIDDPNDPNGGLANFNNIWDSE